MITLCLFFHSFFFIIIDNCHYGSLLRKCLKIKIFLLFTTVFYFLHKFCSDNFALAIICRRTLKKIQISVGKSLGNCRMLRRISKAAAMQELPSDLSFSMFFLILDMALTDLLKYISSLSHIFYGCMTLIDTFSQLSKWVGWLLLGQFSEGIWD